jgi:predicted O-methyltransferase YrrM
LAEVSDLALRWHVLRCRRHSDTKTRYLLSLARCVAAAPRAVDAAPFLEIGTRSGGSALLMLRVLRALYRGSMTPPWLLTVDPYGRRPYEGAPFIYDDTHYIAMKRALAGFGNHVHFLMESSDFLRALGGLKLWRGGVRRPVDHFTLVYLDGSHDPDIVWSEVQSLLPRVVPGGFLIVDDTDWFDGAVRRRLDGTGWDVRHDGKQSVVRVAGGEARLPS